MKNERIVTTVVDEKYVVQFTDRYELNNELKLTVPRQMIAIAYVEGKTRFKSYQCTKQSVIKQSGAEFRGKEIQFAFYSPNYSPSINFGFGPINVNNERLKEAYRVGLHGQMILTVNDPVELINSFTFSKNISVEDIRERLLPIIKSVGLPILSSCFANTQISVFEIDSMIGSIREKITEAFVNENILDKLGIHVDVVTINQIYVNDEDLALIRNRINN